MTILASNPAARALSHLFAPGENILRAAFLEPEMRMLYRDWDRLTTRFVPFLRAVLGAGLTMTGMVGGLFTNFVPGIPSSLQAASLAMPQGWAAHLWSLALAGASTAEMVLPLVVLAAMGTVFFLVGVAINRRSFA